MKSRSIIRGTVLPAVVFLVLAGLSGAAMATSQATVIAKSNVGNFPVHFLPLPDSDRSDGPEFAAEGLAYNALLSSREVMLGLRVKDKAGEGRIGLRRASMQFLNAGDGVRLTGRDHQGAVAHFLMGDRQDWVRNVPLYKKVNYHEIWPGIDAVFYGRMNNLEFDFILRPGADLGRIQLRFQGVDELQIDAGGRLVLQIGDRELPLTLPLTYQETPDGRKEPLGCRFVKTGPDTVGFEIQNHNPLLALVIDPVFHFSTYLGGGKNWYTDSPGYTEDFGMSVAIDNDGNIYVTGVAESSDFFQSRYLPYPGSLSGWRGMFLCKFDPDGNLIYSTRVHANRGTGVTVDALGQVYVTGDTSSDIFPVVGGFQTFPGTSTSPCTHGYFMKINADGNDILYSTYIGGDFGTEKPYGVAVDPDGCAYVTGVTSSSDFITRNPLMENMTRPIIDGVEYKVDDLFVVKIDTNATGDASLLFATTYGGSLYDRAFGIDIDGDRNIYVVGETHSMDFGPLVNPLQDTFSGCQTGFLVKINAACDRVVYSTFLSDSSVANAVAVEDNGHAYVVGTSGGSDILPGRNGFKELPVDTDPFLFRINTNMAGSASMIYGTYLGGTLCDEARGVVTNGHGRVYVTGLSISTDLPGTPASEPLNGCYDAFYSHIDTNLVGDASLIGAAYVGGALNDKGRDVAMGPIGEIALTGDTVSRDFPLEAAFQDEHGDIDNEGGRDAFVAKIIDFRYWSLPVTDIPDGGGTFWYAGTTALRVDEQPQYCRPMAYCRFHRNQLSLSVGLPEFEKDVDVYLTLRPRKYPKLLYFVNGKDQLVRAIKAPIPWRKSTNGSLKAFKSQILNFNNLPDGDWDIAMIVSPEGGSFKKAPYRWETETSVNVTQTIQTDPKRLYIPVTKTAEIEAVDTHMEAEESGSNDATGGCFLSSLF